MLESGAEESPRGEEPPNDEGRPKMDIAGVGMGEDFWANALKGTKPGQRRVMPPTAAKDILPVQPTDLPPPDLPEDHFVQLSEAEASAKKAAHWDEVKDLPDNDTRKILYYRRFPNEHPWKSSPGLSDNFRYYGGVDFARLGELPVVEPYRPKLEVPEGKKIGFVIGYHHLEKPWSRLFMERLLEQAEFPPDRIEFIEIENSDVPTGDNSPKSESEIRAAAEARGITHVIDVHDQFSTLNHYMDPNHTKPRFREANKSGTEGDFTLDPFVPTWAIEQYYQGNSYPQLQYAVNDQLKLVEGLIKSISSDTEQPQ